MLLNGEFSFAESQRSFQNQEYQQAREHGIKLRQISVAMTGSDFYVLAFMFFLQRIFVVVRQDSTLDEMAGTAYANLLLSEKGQALIDQAGYLPMRLKEHNLR
jgi:hypothetical protein